MHRCLTLYNLKLFNNLIITTKEQKKKQKNKKIQKQKLDVDHTMLLTL